MKKTLEGDEVSQQNVEQARRWGILHRMLIGDGVSTYIDRLTLITTPWFSVKLHRIYRPDQQRELHDHPWSFFSVILRGWYEENIPCPIDVCQGPEVAHIVSRCVRWWNWKPAEGRHSIRHVSRTPVWTLVFTGPRRRIWGFWVDGGTRFVPWNEYEKLNEA